MEKKPLPAQTTITIATTGYPPQQQPYVPAQHYAPAPPPPAYQPAYPPVYAPPANNDNWFERNQKNKPQSNSVGSAALIFITGGMNIAWGTGYTLLPTYIFSTHMKMGWFIGGIIGAFVSSIASNYVQRKFIHYFASLLAIIAGIIFTATSVDYDGFLASRYLNGMACGMVFVTSMALVGEQSVQNLRGQVAASIDTLCFSSGFCIQVLLVVLWDPGFTDIVSVNRTHGVICLVLAVLSLAFVLLFMIESPIYHLQRNEEQEALDCLRRLCSPAQLNAETYALLEEHKRYVSVNSDMSLTDSVLSGLPALIKLCLLRALSAMTYSQIISSTLLVLAVFSNYSNTQWIFVMHGVMRLLGAMTTTFMLDAVGRKVFVILGMAVAAGMCFGLGRILAYMTNFFISEKVIAAIYLLIIMQLFSSSFAASSSAYISEAFPLAVKSYFIGIVYMVEMMVALCMYEVKVTDMYIYFYVLGSLLAAYFVFATCLMPETKQTSLREAQAKFRKIFNGFIFS